MRLFCLYVLLNLSSIVFASEWNSFSNFPPLVEFYHPVTTKNREAQEAFNRGLLGIYGFNYDESYASFERASKLDPDLAMAYWGMALALDETPGFEKSEKPYELIQTAIKLSKNASPNEQAYIEALSKRFSKGLSVQKTILRVAYKEAMKTVAATYPEDLDAVILYAESLMDLLHWSLWQHDGTGYEETPQILSLIESVLKRYPLHPGANHYYIHALESSKFPERALMSAYRLDNMLPEWGHLLHSPSHIYILVGDYEKAVNSNKKALEADKQYIEKNGLSGNYPMSAMGHVLTFLCRAYLWQDRYEDALATANQLAEFVLPYLQRMPSLESTLLIPLQVHLYFHNWDKIINYPTPAKELQMMTTFWLFSRSLAYASLGDLEHAKKEKELFFTSRAKLIEKHAGHFLKTFFGIAEDMINAAMAKTLGNKVRCTEFLQQAVAKQDSLDELAWYYPIRQTLGASLIEANKPEAAEIAFKETLEQLPRNGRSLFGLSQALKRQGKFNYWVDREAKEALKNASMKVTIEKL